MPRPFIFLSLIFLSLLGCGGPPAKPMGTAQGKVTWQGNPVTGGSVVFSNPQLGISTVAPLEADGSFTIKTFEGAGLPVGTYKVAIRPGAIATTESPLASDPSKVAAPPPFPVPMQYFSPETSPLSAEVKEGTNPPFNFALPLP